MSGFGPGRASWVWHAVCGVPGCAYVASVSGFLEVMTFLKQAPSSHPGSAASPFHDNILRKSWGLAPFLLGPQSTWPGGTQGPGCSWKTEPVRYWVSFLLGSFMGIWHPSANTLWCFTELLTHNELLHYLLLPDVLWTDFFLRTEAPQTYKGPGQWEKVQLVCAHESSTGGGEKIGRKAALILEPPLPSLQNEAAL